MKHFTVEEIVKIIQKLLEHGYGELVLHIRDRKITHYDYKESHQPEGEK